MSRTIKLPRTDRRWFESWSEYGDTYGVDVWPDEGAMRCRACGESWTIPHNRGRMLKGAHVCPNGCNGKPRARSGGQPPMLRRHLEELADLRGPRDSDRQWREQPVRDDSWDEDAREARVAAGRRRRAMNQIWFDLTTKPEARDAVAALDRLFDEAAMQSDPMEWMHWKLARLSQTDQA